MRHRGGGPRYARQNIKDAPITPQLVERMLALVPQKAAPATTNVVPIRAVEKNGDDTRPAEPTAPAVSIALARPQAKSPDWSADEDDRLRDAYANGERIDLVAEELGRTHGAARSRADKIGLGGTHPAHGGWCTDPVWSEADDALLRDLYGKIDTDEVASRIGRSKRAIFSRAHLLGLQHGYHRKSTGQERLALGIAYRRGLAIADVAAAMGRKAFSLSKYATKHGYNFGRRPLLAAPISLDEIIALADEATPLPAFKNTPRGASGTARKASSAGESTPASRERAATPAPQRRPARAPIAKVQKAAVIRRPAPQPAEEVKASPPPPPIKTETSMPKPPQASAATSAPSCPPRAEVAPLPKKPVMGWVERQMAEVAEAKAYLERRGFAVTRADRDAQIARWFLSGWRWPLTSSELIEAARRARAQEARA